MANTIPLAPMLVLTPYLLINDFSRMPRKITSSTIGAIITRLTIEGQSPKVLARGSVLVVAESLLFGINIDDMIAMSTRKRIIRP
jgi:hypothetical protein